MPHPAVDPHRERA